MNTASDVAPLEHRVRAFASDWLRLGAPGVGDELLADPILVLGPHGTSAMPREAFVSAVTARQASVTAVTTAVTTLTQTTVTPLGDRLVLATMTWSFGQGETEATLISDFLLQHEPDDRLRCVAYLPRTNILDHLP